MLSDSVSFLVSFSSSFSFHSFHFYFHRLLNSGLPCAVSYVEMTSLVFSKKIFELGSWYKSRLPWEFWQAFSLVFLELFYLAFLQEFSSVFWLGSFLAFSPGSVRIASDAMENILVSSIWYIVYDIQYMIYSIWYTVYHICRHDIMIKKWSRLGGPEKGRFGEK